MNTRLQGLLRACGWNDEAENPNYIHMMAGDEGFKVLANSLDIAAGRPSNAERRADFEAARDEAARLAWPPPLDWQQELDDLRAFRKRLVSGQ